MVSCESRIRTQPSSSLGLVTEAAPGHDGAGVSCSNALQDGGLVDVDGEVLRSGQDDGLLVDSGSCSCTQTTLSVSTPDRGGAYLGFPGPGCHLTSDGQLGFVAEAYVGDIRGNTAEEAAVRTLNASDLQHAVGQQGVPAHRDT